MPRPKKERTFERSFEERIWQPEGTSLSELEQIQLHRDELEAMRLCDSKGMTQEEAGVKMGVSRGTIQRILTVARKKTAKALSEGHAIVCVDDVDY